MSKVFMSYSHADEGLRDRLEKHLAMLKRSGAIETWHDRRIVAGDNFGEAIDREIDQADVVLCLVSPDFLDSNYCYENEMQRALQRAERGEAKIIPIILKLCDWRSSPLGKLLAAPKDGHPITKWADEDEAMLDVVRMIREALPPFDTKAPQHNQPPSHEPPQPLVASVRSSNLHIKKLFSDADKDAFLDDSFEFIYRFFEGSLDELCRRNSGIQKRIKRIDSKKFEVHIYRDGKSASQCTIAMAGPFGRGITFSTSTGYGNAYNAVLTVDCDDQRLFFNGSITAFSTDAAKKLSQEGAAEHFWAMLIEPMQR